jgi:hypothetical protein
VRTRQSRLTLLTVAASLALPAGALAQSAGDEQYTDPFAPGEQGQQQQQQQAPPPEPQAPSAPAEAAPAPTPSAEAPAAAEPAAAQPSDPTLPVTGMPALAMLLAGAVLIAGGATVRRRL